MLRLFPFSQAYHKLYRLCWGQPWTIYKRQISLSPFRSKLPQTWSAACWDNVRAIFESRSRAASPAHMESSVYDMKGLYRICTNWKVVKSHHNLTVSESKSAPVNPVMSQSTKELAIDRIPKDESLLPGFRSIAPLTRPWGLPSNSPLRWFGFCRTLPLGPAWELSLIRRAASSASFLFFSIINLFASSAVWQPAARASCPRQGSQRLNSCCTLYCPKLLNIRAYSSQWNLE